MALTLRRESALNLALEGSIGSFRVGTSQAHQHSLEVKYLLTYVGLNFASGANEPLLSALAPVREIFDFNTLDFDEIMQRDIDDARVSSELIPYLLDDKSVDLVKFFPPIVVFVLPVEEGSNRPAGVYPETTTQTEPPHQDSPYPLHVVRSGAIGAEVFQFEQPIVDGELRSHDLARLRLNTHRTKLVIVDGQHRAMALLAIYRNLKDEWSNERRAPFKEYYTEWTPAYINQFNLKDINLPVVLCTVPSLDSQYQGDFDLRKAARGVFLTLNKTARKVSNSRNILLDDSDLIALFLRRTLSEVKRKDSRSPHALRIWNVELDQFGDKMKIQSPIAISGVNHIYYIIEHVLLDSGDVSGVAPRSGKFYKRTNLDDCLDRLGGRDILGAATADNIKRDSFSADAAEKLGAQFDQIYGQLVIAAYERFAPFDCHNRAVLHLETEVEQHQDRQLRPMIFDGQGIGRVFEAHRNNLREKLREGYFRTDVPEIKASADRLDATALRINQAINNFRAYRAGLCLADVSDKGKLRDGASGAWHSKVTGWLNLLFDNVFSTVAFQSAIICGFFGSYEEARRESPSEVPDAEAVFGEYIAQLNAFFIARSSSQFRRMIQVFFGEVEGETASEWEIKPSNQTFRSVVYRGEMQPDQWPKYRYLLLEIWRPGDRVVSKVVAAERQKCRKEIFSTLYSNYRTFYLSEHRKSDEDLDRGEIAQIFSQAFEAYSGFLRNAGRAEPLDRQAMREAVAQVSATASTEANEEGEDWQEGVEAAAVGATAD